MAMRTDGVPGENGQERDALEDMFAAACMAERPVPDALMARVLADGLAVQPRAERPVLAAPSPAPGGWRRLVGLLGGAGALAGMGTAALAGLVIGFVQPVGLFGLEEVVLGTPLETVELIPGVDALLGGN